MATNPKVYDLLNSLAYQAPEYDMAGVNTSSGDSQAPSRPDLHWSPTMAAAQDNRGIPTMPNVDLPDNVQPFDLQQAMAQTQLNRGSDIDPMQAYSDQLLKSPDLGKPSDYTGGTPSGGATQSLRQRVTAPLRDALTSLLHPMGGAPDPTMAASQAPQTPQDLQQFMRDRYQSYAGLTDRNMQTMQDQMRGLNRQDGIDNFLGRVVSPLMGGMMARNGNPYAMQIANKLSSDIDSRTASHRDEAFRLMQAANGYGKQAFDQMATYDPDTTANQVKLMDASTNRAKALSYAQSVYDQRDATLAKNANDAETNKNKRLQLMLEAQKAADLRDQFAVKTRNEVRKIEEDERNGVINRSLAQARINQIGQQAAQFEKMMQLHNRQLQADLWKTKFNATAGLNQLFEGAKLKQAQSDAEQLAQNIRAANERTFNKESGQYEPKMSPGFVAQYGMPDPQEPDQEDQPKGLLDSIHEYFFGQPGNQEAVAQPSYSADDLAKAKAELARRKALRAAGKPVIVNGKPEV
ncbi:MAG: hypothetical protein U0103_23105 [Candidatus Obscuribacterales bacterium]